MMGSGRGEGALRCIGMSIPNEDIKAIAGTSNRFSLGVRSTRVIFTLRVSRVNCRGGEMHLSGRRLSSLGVCLAPRTGVLGRVIICTRGPHLVIRRTVHGVPIGCDGGGGVLANFCERAIRGKHHCVGVSRTVVSICGASCRSVAAAHSQIRILGKHQLLDRGIDSALKIGLTNNPALSVCISVIGGRSTLLSVRALGCCSFFVRRPIRVSGHRRCIVDFHPHIILPCTLCCNGLCVSHSGLSFAHTRFDLSVSGGIGTIRTVLTGGPCNLHFGPRRLSFLIACGSVSKGACLGCVHGHVQFGYS